MSKATYTHIRGKTPPTNQFVLMSVKQNSLEILYTHLTARCLTKAKLKVTFCTVSYVSYDRWPYCRHPPRLSRYWFLCSSLRYSSSSPNPGLSRLLFGGWLYVCAGLARWKVVSFAARMLSVQIQQEHIPRVSQKDLVKKRWRIITLSHVMLMFTCHRFAFPSHYCSRRP